MLLAPLDCARKKLDKWLVFCAGGFVADYKEDVFWLGLKWLEIAMGSGSHEECARAMESVGVFFNHFINNTREFNVDCNKIQAHKIRL